MKNWKALLVPLLCLASAHGHSEMYGYVDAEGVSHYSAEESDARFELLLGNPSGLGEYEATGRGNLSPLNRLAQRPCLKAFEPLLQRATLEFSVELALLKAIMAAESGFSPNAISRKGAIGLMQIMSSTAQRYGLLVDGRVALVKRLRDPETNIRLAANCLSDFLKIFPDQPNLVIASHNAGGGCGETVQRPDSALSGNPELRSTGNSASSGVSTQTGFLKTWGRDPQILFE